VVESAYWHKIREVDLAIQVVVTAVVVVPTHLPSALVILDIKNVLER
jgi:hypothetical protein